MAVRHLELHRLVCEAAICPALHRNLTLIHDRGLQQTQHSAPIRQSGKLCLSQLQNAFTAGACLRPHFQRIRQLFTFSALNPHGKAAVGAALPPRKSILNIVPGNALYCHGHSSPVHRRRKLGGLAALIYIPAAQPKIISGRTLAVKSGIKIYLVLHKTEPHSMTSFYLPHYTRFQQKCPPRPPVLRTFPHKNTSAPARRTGTCRCRNSLLQQTEAQHNRVMVRPAEAGIDSGIIY